MRHLAVILSYPGIGSRIGTGRTPRTPGVINPEVTQDSIDLTICVRGWTKTICPPWQFTSALNNLVCSGCLSLADAQAALVDDWTVAYVQYVLRE
jgi:hypothetical protein